MPRGSLGPSPAERMTQLLTEALETGCIGETVLMFGGKRTPESFEEAWDIAWQRMKVERAYPHKTEPRHQWKEALRATRSEFEACYCGRETMFFHVWKVLQARMVDAATIARARSASVSDEGVRAELVA